jgi:succinate-semialdehyde dehydrogenase / glutarate-semialdehyde dehydrogenase
MSETTTGATTDRREATVLADVPNQLLIGGRWRASSSGATLPVEDPATGKTLVHVADATPEDGEASLSAAVAVQASWAATAPRERGEILRRAYEAIVADVDDLALLMTLEMGKSVAESRGEILYAAEFFRWFSEEAVRIGGRFSTAPDGRTRLLTNQRPVGPCLLITPWNFPMAMGTRKIGPAVAAGCTMVVKPAAQTPLSMLALARILVDAGLPDGVLNVVTTSASGQVMEPLIRDPRLRKLSFTGSTPVGQRLIEQSAQRVLRTSMELGGNAPFVVFDDADVERAVDGAVQAKMRNVGQACTAANRFHVQAGIAPEFTRRLADRLAAMTLGRGTEDGVEVGPLVDRAGREKVSQLVDDAVREGATVATGGRVVDGPGWFYTPTVLADVPATARILQEEVFGPVAPITTFTTEEEGIAAANDTEYGLAAYVFTRDLERAMRVCGSLEAGMVGLNLGVISNPAAPFGGMKASGFGREGGAEGINEYLETQYVAIAAS